MWIWDDERWPDFRWADPRLCNVLRELETLREALLQRCSAYGEDVTQTHALDSLVRNIASSYAIEGEAVDSELLRSSLGRKLALPVEHSTTAEPVSEALAELVAQVTAGAEVAGEVSVETLQSWHGLLFPEGCDERPARVGAFRLPGEPMRVYGLRRAGRPATVHFEAPPGERLIDEMEQLVHWLEDTRDPRDFPDLPGPVRAGIAHLWLVTLHPWDDGNGRMSRLLGDRVLADWDSRIARLAPTSVSILQDRREYYAALEATQRRDLDVSQWLLFFLEHLRRAMHRTLQDLDRTVLRQRFWFVHADKALHAGQRKLLDRMLSDAADNFPEGVTARQYCSLAKVAKATATRHLAELRDVGVLNVVAGSGGRSTRYVLAPLDSSGAGRERSDC